MLALEVLQKRPFIDNCQCCEEDCDIAPGVDKRDLLGLEYVHPSRDLHKEWKRSMREAGLWVENPSPKM